MTLSVCEDQKRWLCAAAFEMLSASLMDPSLSKSLTAEACAKASV